MVLKKKARKQGWKEGVGVFKYSAEKVLERKVCSLLYVTEIHIGMEMG